MNSSTKRKILVVLPIFIVLLAISLCVVWAMIQPTREEIKARKAKEELQQAQQKMQEERYKKVQALVDERKQKDAEAAAAAEKERHKLFNAAISYDDYKVRIRNMDSFDWPEMNLYINGQPLSGYGIRIRALGPGDSITIQLDQFAKDNGERFNPYAYKVVDLWMGNEDHDYQEFKP